MIRSSVVLPEPDGPSSATSSPAATVSDTSSSTVTAPTHQLNGIDYGALGERLRRQDCERSDYLYAAKLAGVHAFLAGS